MATPRNLPRRLRAAIKTTQERLERISRDTPNEHRQIGSAYQRLRSLQNALAMAGATLKEPAAKGNALTDCGPDLRVIPVRVLQNAMIVLDAAYDGWNRPGATYVTATVRIAKSLRIEIAHMINERRAS